MPSVAQVHGLQSATNLPTRGLHRSDGTPETKPVCSDTWGDLHGAAIGETVPCLLEMVDFLMYETQSSCGYIMHILILGVSAQHNSIPYTDLAFFEVWFTLLRTNPTE